MRRRDHIAFHCFSLHQLNGLHPSAHSSHFSGGRRRALRRPSNGGIAGGMSSSCVVRLLRLRPVLGGVRRRHDDANVRPKVGASRHDVFAGLPPPYTGGEPTTSDMMFVHGATAGADVGHKMVKRPHANVGGKELWEDPWRYAVEGLDAEEEPPVYTQVVASREEWHWVERILPQTIIPEVPKHGSYPTPSGWRPPKTPDPAMPYHVARNRYHLFPLHVECRRDQLDMQTLEYDYVELVSLNNITGDVFACEADLRGYLEAKLGRKVATHVNEFHGKIRVKGADRSDVEQFLIDRGF